MVRGGEGRVHIYVPNIWGISKKYIHIPILYCSYWESADVISFVLRQLVRQNDIEPRAPIMHHHNTLDMDQPREKWIKKRTSVKIRNGAPNHRANDLIVKEGNAQVVSKNAILSYLMVKNSLAKGCWLEF